MRGRYHVRNKLSTFLFPEHLFSGVIALIPVCALKLLIKSTDFTICKMVIRIKKSSRCAAASPN
jgi:hypothetical protein